MRHLEQHGAWPERSRDSFSYELVSTGIPSSGRFLDDDRRQARDVAFHQLSDVLSGLLGPLALHAVPACENMLHISQLTQELCMHAKKGCLSYS